MSTILKYLVMATAILALGLTVACKDDSSAIKQTATSGAEAGVKTGAEAGMEAGSAEGAKEGMKEGGKEGGKAAASEVVN